MEDIAKKLQESMNEASKKTGAPPMNFKMFTKDDMEKEVKNME